MTDSDTLLEDKSTFTLEGVHHKPKPTDAPHPSAPLPPPHPRRICRKDDGGRQHQVGYTNYFGAKITPIQVRKSEFSAALEPTQVEPLSRDLICFSSPRSSFPYRSSSRTPG